MGESPIIQFGHFEEEENMINLNLMEKTLVRSSNIKPLITTINCNERKIPDIGAASKMVTKPNSEAWEASISSITLLKIKLPF